MKRMALAAAALLLAAFLSAAEEAPGYGPWHFGMTREEVAAVEEHGPYAPVAATGGLETQNGEFRGGKIPVSFVFGAHGLYQIQLWAYSGRDMAAAIEAFHGAYLHLSEHLGSLHADGTPVPAGLSLAELEGRLPPQFKTGDTESELEEMRERGSIQAEIRRLHLHPVVPPEGYQVDASLIHSPQLGLYWVFVYYKLPPPAA